MPGFLVCLRRAVCPTPTCVGNTTCSPCSGTTTAVHPHMRGEYNFLLYPFYARCGSSPHAWGIPNLSQVPYIFDRFIPTCVGNTERAASGELRPPVHPHMRGEYAACPRGMPHRAGSSPHAWGIPLPSSRYNSWARFIPTCVGNTACGRKPFTKKSVHPHMRGEYAFLHLQNLTERRFIPTCVGNTECILGNHPQ